MDNDKKALLEEKLIIQDDLILLAIQHKLEAARSIGHSHALVAKVHAANDRALDRQKRIPEILGIKEGNIRWKTSIPEGSPEKIEPVSVFEKRIDDSIVKLTVAIMKEEATLQAPPNKHWKDRLERNVESLVEPSIIPRVMDWMWDPRFEDLAQRVFPEGKKSPKEIEKFIKSPKDGAAR